MAGDTVDIGNLQARVTMDRSGFDRGLGGMNTGIAGLSSKISALALPIAAIGAAFVAAAAVSFGAFADFEKGITEVFTLLPNASAEARDAMVEDAKTIAKEMGILPDKVLPALYQAISAGVPEDNVFEFLETANKAAIGGVTDLTTAVDGLTSVVNSYGEDIIDATTASDMMFTAVKLGKTTFGELSSSLADVVPTATGLNLGFENIAAALSTITSQGTTTRKAATNLNQMLSELGKTGMKGFEAFKLAAGKTFPDFIKSGGDLSEAMQIMQTYSEKTGISFLDMFGSVEAGKAAMQLTGKGAEKFASDLLEVSESAGATETAFETMEATSARKMEKLHARFSVMLIDMGAAVEPFATKLMDGVSVVFDWFEANGETLIKPFVDLMQEVSDGFDKISEWWAGNGEGVLTDMGGLFQWLIDTFQPLVDLYRGFWEGQAQKMTEFWEEDGALVMKAIDNIIAAIGFMVENLVALWEFVWPYLETVLDGSLAVVLDLVGVFAALFAGDWEALGDKLFDLSLSVFDLLYSVFEIGFNALMWVFTAFANAVAGIITDVMNAVVQTIEDAINSIIEMINGVISKVNEVSGTSFGLLGTVSFGEFTAPTFEAPTLSGLTGVVKPSETIRTALANAEGEGGGGTTITQNITVNNPEPEPISKTTRTINRDLASQAAGV